MKLNEKNINLKIFWLKYNQVVLIYAFTLLMIIAATLSDKDFLTARNFSNLLLSVLPIALVGFGQTIVIMSAGIDLSVGGIISLSNVVCVALMKSDLGLHWSVAIAAALLVGIICGMLNGLIVTFGKLSPVIVTIATLSIYNGLALLISPIPGGRVDGIFAKALTGKSGFPFPIVLMLLLTLIMTLMIEKTKFGNHIKSVGGNESAAFVSGVNVRRVKIFVYGLAGLFSAFSGIFLTAVMRTGDAAVGSSLTMNSIAVTVIGGTLLSGAVGTVIGTLAGAFILIIANNILNLTGISSFYQYIFQGAVLIAALGISSVRSRKTNI